ncbi:hypothetical protein NG54_12160 [Heyndrickxia ginsengihumi]|uniref:Uncharacterized protein n=1 Tax=Heyndrickxia ginsengihumi TaxID=363870 RepID=A0A0A6XXW1_9BACI|nr:hypothetical protein NG54_12160 [Heyndrickxia ginsengihumi]
MNAPSPLQTRKHHFYFRIQFNKLKMAVLKKSDITKRIYLLGITYAENLMIYFIGNVMIAFTGQPFCI